MTLETPQFNHEFKPGRIHYGRDSIKGIGDAVVEQHRDRVLLVCGSNVGSNNELMNPIEEGLGDVLIDTFDRTTPDKKIETAYEGVERMRDLEINALVAVGGGSSIDIATVMCSLHADYRPLETIREEVKDDGEITSPSNPDAVVPLVVVPTTLAGADLTPHGGIMVPQDNTRVGALAVGDALKPSAGFYDPDLFETTPQDVLANSAMNGFDKGIEAIYAKNANPLTDSMAVRSLEYFRSGLPNLGNEPIAMDRVVIGAILAQHARMAGSSIIHSFGHGLRRHFGVQQGLAHAVMVPYALELLFKSVDARRELMADALVEQKISGDPSNVIIDAIVEIRDELRLPTKLRNLEGVSKDGLRRVAELTYDDPFIENTPFGFKPTVEQLEATLRSAW